MTKTRTSSGSNDDGIEVDRSQSDATSPSIADFQLGGSLSLGSPFGVPVRVHYSYFILALVEVLASIRYRSVKYSIYQFLLYGPILFLTILVHEFGHALTTRKLGGTAMGIILWPLGGFAICGRPDPPTHKSNMSVAFAGPATHIVQMLVWIGLALLFSLAGTASSLGLNLWYIIYGNVADFLMSLCLGAFYLNLALLLFNLFLPAYPLDGGSIFASALLMRGYSVEKAATITSVTAMGISFLLLIWGVLSLFVAQNPFAVFNMLIALWIGFTSYSLYKMVQNGTVSRHPLFSTVDGKTNADAAEP